MKRTRLKRTTPLVAAAPLVRRTPLVAVASGKRSRPKATLSAPAKATLAQRSVGRCEMALHGCTGRATDVAHRIKRGMGGRKRAAAKAANNRLSNTLHACRVCHAWIHARPAEAYELGLMLREHQDPAREPVVYRGELVWLDDAGGVHDYEAGAA